MWREFAQRHRTAISVVGTILTLAALAYALAGKRQEFVDALRGVQAAVLAATVLLQIVALLSRSEAWHLTIEAAGGTVARRVLFRASSMQVLGSVINGNLGVAMRIGALRRSSPDVAPQVPTLIAAEFPILAVEASLAALASFTLIAPLGIPWWAPVIAIALLALVSAGLRHLAVQHRARALEGPHGPAHVQPRQPRRLLRARRGLRADLPQLDAAARGRRASLVPRRDRGADRRSSRSASCRSGPPPAPRRRCSSSGATAWRPPPRRAC